MPRRSDNKGIALPDDNQSSVSTELLKELIQMGIDYAQSHNDSDFNSITFEFDTVVHESLEPVQRGIIRTVRRIMGEKSPVRDIQLCAFSVMAQCMAVASYFDKDKKDIRKMPLNPSYRLDHEDIAALVAHICRFSLAGVFDRKTMMPPPK